MRSLATQHIDMKMTLFDNVKAMRKQVAMSLKAYRKITKDPQEPWLNKRIAYDEIEHYSRVAAVLRSFKIK